MTYREYNDYLKVCDYFGKEPAGQYKKIHDFLTGLWDGMGIDANSQTNRILLRKKGEWFFEQDSKNGKLWCSYDRVWSFFQNDMGMNLTDTQGFIKSMVEEHIKHEVGTPRLISC